MSNSDSLQQIPPSWQRGSAVCQLVADQISSVQQVFVGRRTWEVVRLEKCILDQNLSSSVGYNVMVVLVLVASRL